MKKVLIIGNWKMNKTNTEVKDFLHKLEVLLKENESKLVNNLQYGIAAPFTALDLVSREKTHNTLVFAENFSQHNKGAYTGEVSAEMLLDLKVNGVVLGHSERREHYGETDEIVNAKTHQALATGLLPVVCVGENLAQYETGETKTVIREQIEKSLAGIEEFSKVVIAYEPIWAIGTGRTATAEIAQDICSYIRSITASNAIIQYGGSVSPANIEELMNQKDIDGALVGGASLEVESFVKLLTFNK